MCHVLGVKNNNYYSYQKRKSLAPVDTEHQEMLQWVKNIAEFSDNTYGQRRIQKALNSLDYPVGRKVHLFSTAFASPADQCVI